MDQNRWAMIERLFERALELNEQERIEYLKGECGNDEELFQEVHSLIDADSKAHPIFNSPTPTIEIPDNLKYEGKIIGAYKIVKQIGLGGMGSVYLAERADGQFEQKVALKLIKPGNNSFEIIKRFQAERQILARLQHPNIARLLDGGITNDGLPYFTMEYVEGDPIDVYCDKNKLSIKERLELFITVCTAVNYAHQNLIIHRDLKPGNIYITKDGRVKLLDFGISKVFTEDDSENFTKMTQTGLFIMTPEYAAPEQIRGEIITTATDIYALGLILFQLLTGSFPYKLNSFAPLELEKVICLTDPDKPSTIITRANKLNKPEERKDAQSIFATRNIEPSNLKKILIGDLDNICMMALRKEPSNRYNSVEQFKDDISKYLNGLPVSARTPTIKYRTQKFIKRHYIVLSAAALVVLLVAILTTVYFIQLKDERDKAKLEAQKAEQVSQFLESIFKVADPSESRGDTITAKELLERGAKKINDELDNQPDVKATMMDVIARVYMNFGSYDKADTLFSDAYKIRRSLYTDNSLEAANSLNNLAETSIWNGKYEDAHAFLNKALKLQDKFLDENDSKRLHGLNNLAYLLSLQGNYNESDSVYKIVIDLYKKNNQSNSPELFTVMNNRALVLHENAKYKPSEKLFKEALELQKKYYGSKPHPELSTTTYNLGELLRDEGEFDESEKMFRQSLAMDIKLHGIDHPDVAYSMQGLASVLRQKGNYEETLKFDNECLRIRKKFLGPNHPDVAYAYFNLGLLNFEIQNLDEAEKNYTSVLEIQKKSNEENLSAIGKTIGQLAEVKYFKGDLTKAEKLLNESDRLIASSAGVNHLNYARNLLQHSRIESKFGNYNKAIHYAIDGYGKGVKAFGKNVVPFTAAAIKFLGDVYKEMGNYISADSCLRVSYEMHKEMYSSNFLRTASTAIEYADVLIKLDSLSKASKMIDESSKVFGKIKTKYNWQLDKAEGIKGELYSRQNNYELAEKLLLKSFNSLKEQLGIMNMITQGALNRLVDFYNKWDKKSLEKKYQVQLTKFHK